MERLKNLNYQLIFNIINAGMIGLITGAFLGAFPLRLGMLGALFGAGFGAVILVGLILLLRWMEWETAKKAVFYGSIGILPGLLIGGSKMVGLGVTGAFIFGLVSMLLYSTVINKLVTHHASVGTYVLYPGHYAVLFLLGSISIFITILIVGFLSNVLDIEGFIQNLPFLISLLLIAVVIILLYAIRLLFVKRRNETWAEAYETSKLSLVVTIGLLLIVIGGLLLTRFGLLPLNTLIFIVVGLVIPFVVGVGLPLSLGYLMAHNVNRPTLGSVLAILGSLFVIYIGIQVAPMLLLPGSGLMWAGLITGLFMLMFALSALFKPDTHFFAGTSIIVFSILSFIGAAGGLIIGGILGLVGGILIASWAGLEIPVEHDPDAPLSTTSEISSGSSETISG